MDSANIVTDDDVESCCQIATKYACYVAQILTFFMKQDVRSFLSHHSWQPVLAEIDALF